MNENLQTFFPGLRSRISSDSVWPLRCANGMTFAQRKAEQLKKQEEADAAVRDES